MLNKRTSPLVTIFGPTASGKTTLGVYLSELFNGEVISIDSRQVFTGMDIGTGKDLNEYKGTPYHLIDIAEPGEEYNLFRFANDFCQAYDQVLTHNALPIAVGGTGMYLDALLRRYALAEAPPNPELRQELEQLTHDGLLGRLRALSPTLHNQTDTLDKERTLRAIEIAMAQQQGAKVVQWPDYQPLVLGLQFPREVTRSRITDRLKRRLQEGMVEEVQGLIDRGVAHASLEHYGLEYRFLSLYLRNELSYNDMYQKLLSAIHQFAKQQEKWFRNIEKKGVQVHWLNTDNDIYAEAKSLVSRYLDR